MNTTASGLKRFLACAASGVLPRISSTSQAAMDGTEIHTFLEDYVHIGRERALEKVGVDLWGRCDGIDVEAILKDFDRQSLDIEAAYALDPFARKARKVGNSIGRDYHKAGVTETEVGGSEDVIGKLTNGKWCVMDYKSGENVGDPATNPQLMFFAACLYLTVGAPEVEGRIVYIGEDGSHAIESATFSVFDMEDFLDSLAATCHTWQKLSDEYKAGRQVSVSVGDHCKYCPCLAACPAYTSLARRLVPELEEIDNFLATLTPEQAGIAWVKYKQIKAIYDKVEEGLKSYARDMELELPGGRVVGRSAFSRRYFSTDKAVRLLGVLGASQEDIESCYSIKEIVTIREMKKKEQ